MWLQHRSDLTANKIALSTGDRIEATQTGVVLLLQTKNVLSNAHCLSQLYKAAANSVPIVPAYLTSKLKEHSKYMYSFEETTGFLRDLVSNLSAEATAEIQNTTGTKVETVGMSLCLLMPSIISKPLTCDSLSEREPQLAQIGEPSGGSSASAACPAAAKRCRSRLTEPLWQLAPRYRRPPPILGHCRGRAERRARRCGAAGP